MLKIMAKRKSREQLTAEYNAILKKQSAPELQLQPVTETPVVPDLAKTFKANNVPPKGLEAYQMARDGGFWSVWAIRVKQDGDIETEKLLTMEPFDLCREKVLGFTIAAQIKAIG